jgi:hypothetical protein
MDSDPGSLPDDLELKAPLVAEAARAAHAEAELAVARAKASDDQTLIAHQQLQIEKLRRELYGPRSERTSRILDQIELQFEELKSAATEDEIAAEIAVAKTTTVAAYTRERPMSQCRGAGGPLLLRTNPRGKANDSASRYNVDSKWQTRQKRSAHPPTKNLRWVD